MPFCPDNEAFLRFDIRPKLTVFTGPKLFITILMIVSYKDFRINFIL